LLIFEADVDRSDYYAIEPADDGYVVGFTLGDIDG